MSLSLLFVVLLTISWNSVGSGVVLGDVRDRSKQLRRKEDYSFESKLKRATEECSYIAKNEDESHREELISRIKNEINNRKVEEFYRERDEEKKKSKMYYDNVERQVRRKVLKSNQTPQNGPWPRTGPPRRRYPPVPLPPTPFRRHDIFKRSAKDQSFSQGTFKEHNNCFSRCVFARMELVDTLGFPQESYMRKALEDHIDNRKIRFAKIRRVYKCFDDIKKVAIDDNCIYSTRIFKCMKLDEPGVRS